MIMIMENKEIKPVLSEILVEKLETVINDFKIYFNFHISVAQSLNKENIGAYKFMDDSEIEEFLEIRKNIKKLSKKLKNKLNNKATELNEMHNQEAKLCEDIKYQATFASTEEFDTIHFIQTLDNLKYLRSKIEEAKLITNNNE